ncbi:MAG: MMPL family transporter [Methylobacteriaceae bacterium]|nr:MMPL family transporter [Methylobacteriaceae bacterium]
MSEKKDYASFRPSGALTAAIVAIVDFCCRRAWLVVILSILVSLGCGVFAARHFAINTDINQLISPNLPWRQKQLAFDKAFPQRQDQIIVVIDARTAELGEEAAAGLAEKLKARPDQFEFVRRPDGDDFFRHDGLLFQSPEKIQATLEQAGRGQALLAPLAADPSLRGLMDSFGMVSTAVQTGQAKYQDFSGSFDTLGDVFEDALNGKTPFFSWRKLMTGEEAGPRELRRFIEVKPKLDFSSLQPGEAATSVIRSSVAELGLTPDKGVRVRLTGDVPLSDEEFATVQEHAWANNLGTVVIVLVLLFLALKSPKIVFAVYASVAVGLVVTAAIGLAMVGALNLISIAFAVLFIGIGADFGIQFSVRYRAERHAHDNLHRALDLAASRAGRPLALAATATACGFLAFVPTVYRGVSELGLIAGVGMIIAFIASITVLPALLMLTRPGPEAEQVGYQFLAPGDRFIARHRYVIVFGTLAIVLLATPLLRNLTFDFNPLNLRSNKVESVSTLLDLMNDPDNTPNTIDVIAPSVDAAGPLAQRLSALPEVRQVVDLATFVPQDQDRKIAMINGAAARILPAISPQGVKPPPSDAEDKLALNTTADKLQTTSARATGKVGDQAKRFVSLLHRLADAPESVRNTVRTALIPPLKTTIELLRDSLRPEPVRIDTLPAELKREWVAAGGETRVQVSPKGDANDNATLQRFTDAVYSVSSDAVGTPVAIVESGKTVVQAFAIAGALALGSIAILLFIVLRRISDVLLTLVPLLLAGLVTLEICVLIGLKLNFANIIALPLLLGLGVAFKIYFVMAWRAGVTELLQSSLTRAVFFSALSTATAFGSLWLSSHPGTSSMGKLLALSLVCTLAAAVLFQPALMGPPRVKAGHEAA